jgi:hypothetical protein
MSRSSFFWLCLLVVVALVPVGALLWFAGDSRHALGVAPLVLLLVCPLVLAALRKRARSPSGAKRAVAAHS